MELLQTTQETLEAITSEAVERMARQIRDSFFRPNPFYQHLTGTTTGNALVHSGHVEEPYFGFTGFRVFPVKELEPDFIYELLD